MANHSPQAESGGGASSIVHLAEAIEGKHRVRERLVRVLARVHAPEGERERLPFEANVEAFTPPEPELGLNPLGEYLLTGELHDGSFRL
jgi:hypothetical protein